MRAYVFQRLLLFVPVLVGVSVIIFVIMRVLPGDVARTVLLGVSGEGVVTEEALRNVQQRLGLDKPLVLQYLDWIWGVVRLDFGTSFKTETPIAAEIAQRLPITFEMAILTALVSTAIAVPVGTISAIHQDKWIDYALRGVTILGLAAPSFWIGVLTIIGLVRLFNWIPPIGFVTLWEDPGKNIQQMIWPAVGLGYHYAAVVARMTRSSMLEVLRQDYIRTAWAKGLRERVVVYRHALKNSLLPVITIIGIQFALLLGGTVIMETIFSVPGMGRTFVDAIAFRDYPMVQASVVVFAVLILLANLGVDLLYAWLDPRVGYGA
ncbi:MAG: ABC transporter permease [Dehalococcoidia bacterium]|nr:ABC transporter permease [Dehalococcoidia bacterium]